MIVKKGLCFNSANSACAEIDLYTFFPHNGKRTIKAGMKKDIQGDMKNIRHHIPGDAVPDRSAVLCLEEFAVHPCKRL